MTQHLFIITGASRGLGLAMARQLLQAGNTLLCISRTANDALTAQAQQTGANLLQWTQDLAFGTAACMRMEQGLNEHTPGMFASATLINNACAIPRIGPLRQADVDDLSRSLRIGLEAPMQLTSTFLRATANWTGQRKVLNISSGLGRRAMASQAIYCAVKAGMDHFTRCVALEEVLKTNGAKICSLAPGVIDTEMQEQLRAAPGSDFPDRSSFLNLKTSGVLSSADDAAKKVIAVLMRADFGTNPVADVRD